MSIKISSDIIGNWTHAILACSAVHQCRRRLLYFLLHRNDKDTDRKLFLPTSTSPIEINFRHKWKTKGLWWLTKEAYSTSMPTVLFRSYKCSHTWLSNSIQPWWSKYEYSIGVKEISLLASSSCRGPLMWLQRQITFQPNKLTRRKLPRSLRLPHANCFG